MGEKGSARRPRLTQSHFALMISRLTSTKQRPWTYCCCTIRTFETVQQSTKSFEAPFEIAKYPESEIKEMKTTGLTLLLPLGIAQGLQMPNLFKTFNAVSKEGV